MQTGPEAATRLREIADARATRAGMWAAFLSLGLSAVLYAFGVYALNGNPRTLIWALGGALLAAAAFTSLRAERRRIPGSGRVAGTRGPGTLREGLLATGGILLLLNVMLIPTALLNGSLRLVLLTDGGMVLLLVSVLVVPAAVIGGARSSLRRTAQRDPRMQEALEGERLTWTPTAGVPMFGPL